MKTLLLLLLWLMIFTTHAAPCNIPPKVGLTASEVQIASAENGSKLYFAWPTTDPAKGCCVRIPVSMIQSIITPDLDQKLSEFVLTAGSNLPTLTDAETAFCQTLINKVQPIGPVVVRNAFRTDGARPLKKLTDPAQPYSVTNPLIDFKPAAYVEAGRPCERTPVVNSTTAGQWLYVTNLAGTRGIALCK